MHAAQQVADVELGSLMQLQEDDGGRRASMKMIAREVGSLPGVGFFARRVGPLPEGRVLCHGVVTVLYKYVSNVVKR